MSDIENKDSEILENPHYERGFNNGYLISKHEPELSDKLLVSLNQVRPDDANMYLEGLRYGMLERELEKAKEPYKQYDKKPSSPDKNKDRDMDIDPSK